MTGRTLYHFHTRTKTGRAPQLQAAAPEVWVEMSPSDAADRGWGEGDLLEVGTPRGRVEARLRVSGIRPGVLFLPFHYGYWDTPGGHEPDGAPGRAANELTPTDWDPVSKQPIFKTAAAQVELLERGDGRPAPAPTTTGSRPVTHGVPPTRGGAAALVEEREGARSNWHWPSRSCTGRRPTSPGRCSPSPTGTRPTTRSSTSPGTSPAGRSGT
ncbi:molybdopterin dinucleotide binding domain-containing protein [Geodermatophilus sp. URMC 62]|uniref:molybdopterin dinucleotide binding domain-containing protein n=1 Tax=Geodermatophilus sp. URMC 62 TaxID=3423414 RepID=UPI00406BFA74